MLLRTAMREAVTQARRVLRPVKRAWLAADRRLRGEFDAYLAGCRGVIHVGANTGQERDLYASHGLAVVWIEPIPEFYRALQENIAAHPEQRAVEALITDRDGEECVLHVANNDGGSSSILDLHRHRDLWPEVGYVRDVKVRSSTLPSALRAAGIDAARYDALVLDTQGSELLVLRGAAPLLGGFKYVQTEAADFEAYRGGATVSRLVEFMRAAGFRLARKQRTAGRAGVGSYYELLFRAR